jgi:hypothetical protein
VVCSGVGAGGVGVGAGGSTHWSAVAALPRGQFIFVTVDGGETRASSLYSVSDTAVTLWYDWGAYALPRASVTHVVARVQVGTKEDVPWGDIALTGDAVIGGAVGYSWWNTHKNKNKVVTDWSGAAVVGAIGLLWRGSETETKPVCEDRLVYIRP